MLFLIYSHPKRYKSPFTPKDFGVDYQNITLLTKDNVKIDAWFIKKPNSSKAVILCHGYPMDKGNIFDMTRFLSKEYRLNIATLMECLSKELNVQFAIVSHIPELEIGKVIRL